LTSSPVLSENPANRFRPLGDGACRIEAAVSESPHGSTTGSQARTVLPMMAVVVFGRYRPQLWTHVSEARSVPRAGRRVTRLLGRVRRPSRLRRRVAIQPYFASRRKSDGNEWNPARRERPRRTVGISRRRCLIEAAVTLNNAKGGVLWTSGGNFRPERSLCEYLANGATTLSR
jgi:hypothetical protein